MYSRSYPRTTMLILSVTCCFTLVLIVFRIDVVYRQMAQDYQHETTGDNYLYEDLQCPVSTKPRTYAQAHIDTALFEKFWSNPIMCYGTFVELGALDGDHLSNTKFFEEYLGWNGVLIEAYYKNFEKLKQNRPTTSNHNVAICPEGQGPVNFIGKGAVGGIVGELSERKMKQFNLSEGEQLKVPCEPIGPLLRKSNITKIDLFSLDVEGAEMMVLHTMDWSIPIHVFIIEMEGNKESNQLIRDLMKNHSFIEIKHAWDINTYSGAVNNEVFINPKYESMKPQKLRKSTDAV